MAKTATATRVRRPVAAKAKPRSLFETDEKLDKMPAEFRECYGDRHPFVVVSREYVMRGNKPIQQIVYLRCPVCTMKATDTWDIIKAPSGRYVMRRACSRAYERPSVTAADGTVIKYGIQGRVDHDVVVTYRLLRDCPELVDMLAGA